jgi:DNA-binding transcriptional LysR family regulator
MDIEFARTFLAVVDTGNFHKAAQQLNVTQSTVSMRVKALEGLLGRPLLTRSRAGATATAAGQQFRRYALQLVRAWEQARQEVSMPAGYQTMLAIGGQFTLWDRLLLKWLGWIRATMPDVAVRAEVALSDGLMRMLSEGLLDMAVMYTPQTRPGLIIEQFMVETLVLVTTDASGVDPRHPGYVFIDWGPEFRASHSAAYPDLSTPALSVSHGPLGLQHILDNGGSGYFPMRLVREHVAAGRLLRVTDAAEFSRPAHLVYPAGRDGDSRFVSALRGLRAIAAPETEA